MLYGFSTFLPTIIRAIRPSASDAEVQLLTIPCYALGAISYMSSARFSDWKQLRGPVVCVFCIISVVGYALLMSDVPSGVHYFGCFLVAMGLYVSVGIPLAWLPSNNPRYGKRTTGTGLQLTIGNSSGIMASFVGSCTYLNKSTARAIADQTHSCILTARVLDSFEATLSPCPWLPWDA